MLSVYKAVRGEFRLSGSPEQSEKVQVGLSAAVGDRVDMGGHRLWHVVKTETYQFENLHITVAAVIPDGIPLPPESEWTGVYWPDYPERTFAVAIGTDGSVITTESHMEGKPMSGIVEIATIASSGKAMLTNTNWMVEHTITFMPTTIPSAYAGIHLCHCVQAVSPSAIAA